MRVAATPEEYCIQSILIPRSSNANAHRRISSKMRFDGLNHWIAIEKERRCASGCKGTSFFFYEKRNVGLHPQCFEIFHAVSSSVENAVLLQGLLETYYCMP